MSREEFKAERTKRGTQKAIAALLGCHPVTLAKWESGAYPQIPRMAEVALLSLPVVTKGP